MILVGHLGWTCLCAVFYYSRKIVITSRVDFVWYDLPDVKDWQLRCNRLFAASSARGTPNDRSVDCRHFAVSNYGSDYSKTSCRTAFRSAFSWCPRLFSWSRTHIMQIAVELTALRRCCQHQSLFSQHFCQFLGHSTLAPSARPRTGAWIRRLLNIHDVWHHTNIPITLQNDGLSLCSALSQYSEWDMIFYEVKGTVKDVWVAAD